MSKRSKIVLLALCGIFLCATLIQSFIIGNLTKKNQAQAVELMNANDSVTTYKTKAGALYFDLLAVSVEKNSLKSSLAAAGFEIKELQEKDIRWRNIVSTLKAELAMTGNDTIRLQDTVINVVGGDPITGKKYNWTNNYLTLAGLIREKTMDIHYSYKTGMSFITEQKGKSTKVTAFLADPQARITKGSQIIIDHKIRWYEKPWMWGLLGAGVGFYFGK